MAEYAGTASYVEWVYSGGTAVLSGNYRTASYSQNAETIDATAGSDTRAVKLPGIISGGFSVAGLMDTGGSVGNKAGTLFYAQQIGTIVYGPEGTAAGKLKITIPAVMLTFERNTAYNAAAEFSMTFDQSAAESYGTF